MTLKLLQAKVAPCTTEETHGEVTIIAPVGQCFEPGLHLLVTSAWDDDKRKPQAWLRAKALADFQEHRLNRCTCQCCLDDATMKL